MKGRKSHISRANTIEFAMNLIDNLSMHICSKFILLQAISMHIRIKVAPRTRTSSHRIGP